MKPKSTEELYQQLENDYFGENMQEKEELISFQRILNGVNLFIDAGASLGQYAYFANQHLTNARVVCIEADSLRFPRLQELLSKWNEGSTNKLEAVHAAVSNEDGHATFYETNDSLCGGLHQYWNSEEKSEYGQISPKAVSVRCITLDEYFKDQTPDLIKIDVEGAEFRAVSGAQGLLRARKTRFAVEMHPWGDKTLGKTTPDVFKLFHSYNYNFNRLHKLWHFYPNTSLFPLWPKYQFTQLVMGSNFLRPLAKKVMKLFRGKNHPTS